MVEVIFADEVEGEERVQSTADPQKWEIQTHVRRQTNTSTHIHIYKDKKATQTEGQPGTQPVSQRGTSRPLYHSVGTIQNPLD